MPQGLQNVIQVVAGDYHTLALKADGTMVAWGDNTYGQCNVPASLSGVVQVAAGLGHSLALKLDGTVVGWGDTGSGYYPSIPPAGLRGVAGISAAWIDSLAVKLDGTVVAWGHQQVVPQGLGDAVSVAAGGRGEVLVLKRDGTVVQWGGITGPPPEGLSGVAAIAMSRDYGMPYGMALKTDGTVAGWGNSVWNGLGQTEIPYELSGVVAIAAGGWHNLALVRSGPPSLILLGDNPIRIEAGTPFVDPGARATDVNGVDLTSRIVVTRSVNPHEPGN